MDSDTMAMDLDTTDTARGLLMLRPIPTFLRRTLRIWTWVLRTWTWIRLRTWIQSLRQEVC